MSDRVRLKRGKRVRRVEPDVDGGEGPPESSRMGRPPIYRKEFVKIAKTLCSRGATDAELASAFGVSTFCINKWQSKHPEFGQAVREGKAEIFDPRVERALAQRALGYSVDCEEVKITKDGAVVRYNVRKHFPPDTTAAIFWLKNRQPARWRDVWKIDHEGKVQLEGLTSEQVLEDIRKEIAALGLASTQLAAVGIAPPTAPIKSDGETKH